MPQEKPRKKATKVPEDTESFKTDPSMREYDMMMEPETPMNNNNDDNMHFNSSPKIGDGLVREFHPPQGMHPSNMFDESASRKSGN